ncbi:hypothetical protein EIP86_007473 [Pleurotus ostreatoroseus]|nr:hypothetical protein EIP86_007473 [Pleurotus ostreatoroseus]
MEKLPPEIHTVIISYACTSPSTAISLSLVSKYFRDVSEIYRWKSVSLTSAVQIIAFAKLVESRSPMKCATTSCGKSKSISARKQNTPHTQITASPDTQELRNWPIYDLFVSDKDNSRDLSCPLDCDPTHFSLQRASRYAQLPTALRTILTYATPTLLTLSIFSDTRAYEESVDLVSAVLSFNYPLVRELTLRAGCTPAQVMGPPGEPAVDHGNAGSSDGLALDVCRMPALQRLHLALPYHGFENGNLDATYRLLYFLAPRAFAEAVHSEENEGDDSEVLVDAENGTPRSALSHLRFTMLDKWGSRRVVEVLHAELAALHIVAPTLALPPAPSDWDIPLAATASHIAWARLLPTTLSLFAIQPSPTSTFYCSCCMDLRGDVDVMRVLERMGEVADKERFLYLQRRSIKIRKCRTDPAEVAGYGFVEAQLDWQERIQGEAGCWRAREDIDLDCESDTSVPPFQISPRTSTAGKQRRTKAFMSRVGNAFKKLKVW